jgi:hypothetical protein
MRTTLHRILTTGAAAVALTGAAALAPAPASASDAGIQSTKCAAQGDLIPSWYAYKCDTSWPWSGFYYQVTGACSISGPGPGEVPVAGAVGHSRHNKIWSRVECQGSVLVRANVNTW